MDWNKPKQLERFEGDSSIFPYFSNSNYALKESVPTLYGTQEIDNSNSFYKYKIVNINWKKLSGTSELYSINPRDIPIEEEWNCSASHGKLNYFITAYKKQGAFFYQLQSFEIVKEDKTTTQKSQFDVFAENTDNAESVLRSGNYYKIKIDKTGIYKLDYDFFRNNGIDISKINPKNIRIYGNGGVMLSERIDDFRYGGLQENAITVVGEEDQTFDVGDYVLFYAQGADTWKRNFSNTVHQKNIYEDYAYYYVYFGETEGKRIEPISYGNPSVYFTTYDEALFFEEEDKNISSLGRIWVGKEITIDSQQLTFEVPNLNTNHSIRTNLSYVASSGQNLAVSVSLNGSNIISENVTSNDFFYKGDADINSSVSNSSQLNYTISVDNSLNPSGKLYLDYIESIFECNLSYIGEQMSFQKFSPLEDGNLYGFKISNANTIERVWNVSDITNASSCVNLGSASSYEFSYQSNATQFKNEFIAFTDDSAYTPEWIGRVNNQNIRSLSDVDYFIISYSQFIPQANRLKEYHESNGMNVEVVTPEQIYNEFSSGSQDITAIRDFLRYHYTKDGKKLKYVLLFGGASYDFKDRISNNTNFVPAYQSINSVDLGSSFVTDDYYTILEDGESELNSSGVSQINSYEMDIAIGRLPASNLSEAKAMVDKTLGYVNDIADKGTPFGDWRTKIHFVVDDDKLTSTSTFHSRMESSISNFVETNLPDYTLNKLYIDSFQEDVSGGGQRFPQVNRAIRNAIETGTLLINYFGHGGNTGWAQERILTLDDISNNTNFNSEYTRLPLIMTITCDFSIWDNPNLISGGQLLIKNGNGGSFAILTTSRAIGVGYGLSVNQIFVEELFEKENNNYLPIGEAVRKAKVRYNSYDNRRVNLLGDPAIPLARPQQGVSIDKINGINASDFNQTIKALEFVSIEGKVLKSDSTLDENFNGTITGTLFDKPVTKKTLNNDGDLPILEYSEQISAVFRGSTKVENGEYKLEFYVPKDINYDVGNAKLTLYAENGTTDAITAKSDVSLGGINSEGLDDKEPPVVRLYMNNTNFVDGGITDNSPFLVACVSDNYGINATGSGVGHDITAVLDGNILDTYVLNEFYEGGEKSPCGDSDLSDYQQGKVVFPLQDLELGSHQITFKIWDINNNSSTVTLDFVVVAGGSDELILKRVLNWPNPFTDKTYFHFEHNCHAPLDVQVQVFTITGKLVKTIRGIATSSPVREGFRTDKYAISWDGLDDFGDKLGKGTYIYRLKVQSLSPNECKGSATAIEKLVLIK
ncbi:MAG: type IX secretion system sortase PorU [Flavobacteriales bacterium]|nr:type IX secretion system sortase PorU [Flavobacteriales bacterium]